MTLILAMATPSYIAIAADRMLSVNGVPTRRNATKLVMHYNEMVFGYTGDAMLFNEKGQLIDTDRWLVNVLVAVGKKPLGEVLAEIQRRAEEAMATRLRRLGSVAMQEFIGVGWKKSTEDENQANALMCRITNCRDDRDRRVSDPYYMFRTIQEDIPPRIIAASSVGYPQDADEINLHKIAVAKAATQSKPAMHMLTLMVESIRRTSDSLHDKWVGKDLLAAIIPKETAFHDDIAIGSPKYGTAIFVNDANAPTPAPTSWFFRFPELRSEGVFEAPHIVCVSKKMSGIVFGQPRRSATITADFLAGKDGMIDAILNFRATLSHAKRPKRKRQKRRRS